MNLLRRVLILSLAALPAACQRYEPRPLDLASIDRDVRLRDPASADVVAYAERLAASRPTTVATTEPAGLTLARAEAVALFYNPALRLARLKANVPRAGAAEAGRWPDPEFSFDSERIIQAAEHPWVLGGSLGFTIPLSGRLGGERDKAAAEASAEELRAFRAERELVATLRRQWVEWSAAAERATLAKQYVATLDAAASTADRLLAAGEIQSLDARLLQIERATATAKAMSADADVATAELAVKATLGLSPDATVALRPDWTLPPTQSPSTRPANDGLALLAEHPRLRAARAEYETAEKSLRLEVRKQYPDLKLGGGFGTEDGENRVLFGLGLPIPIFDGNRRAIAEARAARDAAGGQVAAEYEALLGELAAARVRHDAAVARLAYVEKHLAPLADQQVSDARRRGDLGDASTLVLLEALRTANEGKLQVVEARSAAAAAARALESLTEGNHVNPGRPGTEHR